MSSKGRRYDKHAMRKVVHIPGQSFATLGVDLALEIKCPEEMCDSKVHCVFCNVSTLAEASAGAKYEMIALAHNVARYISTQNLDNIHCTINHNFTRYQWNVRAVTRKVNKPAAKHLPEQALGGAKALAVALGTFEVWDHHPSRDQSGGLGPRQEKLP